MKELVFLLEEESAKAMLLGLLPRVLDPQVQPRLMVFEGKQDLEKQMVKRLRGYVNPHARFGAPPEQRAVPNLRSCGEPKPRAGEANPKGVSEGQRVATARPTFGPCQRSIC